MQDEEAKGFSGYQECHLHADLLVQCHIIHPIIPVEAHQALVLRHAVQLLLGVALVQDVDHALQLHHLGLQINKTRALIRCTTF